MFIAVPPPRLPRSQREARSYIDLGIPFSKRLAAWREATRGVRLGRAAEKAWNASKKAVATSTSPSAAEAPALPAGSAGSPALPTPVAAVPVKPPMTARRTMSLQKR
jgi:hypothetical protein